MTITQNTTVQISHPDARLKGIIHLPSSKSESNRVLIINALTQNKCQLENLSAARDTVTMRRLLASNDPELDVIDAGTTMRFLTAYCAITGRKAILTGTDRMCERPIGILVDALRDLGAKIDYVRKECYPPILIHGFSQAMKRIAIRGDVSSQYISALLMVAPALPQGLELQLLGYVGSKPYIQMTLQLMQHFGIQAVWRENTIFIAPQKYLPTSYFVESDWSGASYWYSMVSLAQEADIELVGLKENSLQGDKAIVEIMDKLGVKTVFGTNSIFLSKKETVKELEWDFTDCPDLAQTIAVVAAAKGIRLIMKGLQSLRIKETDRIAAIVQEIEKFGCATKVIGDSELHILANKPLHIDNQLVITYKDHRMAMAFAPLALLGSISIEQPEVVDKSYPSFWDDLRKVDFSIQ